MSASVTPLPAPPLVPTPLPAFSAMYVRAPGAARVTWFVARTQTGRSVCICKSRAEAEGVAREMNLAAMRAEALR